jgi:hypothetical protein
VRLSGRRRRLIRLSRLRQPLILRRALVLRRRCLPLLRLLRRGLLLLRLWRSRLLLLNRRTVRGPTRTPVGGWLRTGGGPGRLRAGCRTGRATSSGSCTRRCGPYVPFSRLLVLAVRARRLLALGLRSGQTRSGRALRMRRPGPLRCALTFLRAHLDAVRGVVTCRRLGGGLFRVAFIHCLPPGHPHLQVPPSGSQATLPVLTPARNRPRPRPRSNWNHHPQEPHLQVVPLLLLSRG